MLLVAVVVAEPVVAVAVDALVGGRTTNLPRGLGDMVLIAGKGHEDYQIIGTKKFHFDDREVAREAIQQLRDCA